MMHVLRDKYFSSLTPHLVIERKENNEKPIGYQSYNKFNFHYFGTKCWRIGPE